MKNLLLVGILSISLIFVIAISALPDASAHPDGVSVLITVTVTKNGALEYPYTKMMTVNDGTTDGINIVANNRDAGRFDRFCNGAAQTVVIVSPRIVSDFPPTFCEGKGPWNIIFEAKILSGDKHTGNLTLNISLVK